MKQLILVLLIFLTPPMSSYSQKATVSERKVVMKTYMFSDPDPVPDMEKNYPYFKFDGFTNESIQKEWNMVVLENDYIKVLVNTDIGGKIWGAIEKSSGKEFLYLNDVVKFRDVAHRGAWTSGGLEYNFGIMSHISTCATPQDYVIREYDDGSVSVIVGALDLHTNTRWNVEIHLPKDKAYVETRAFWFNSHELPVSYYHYMNAAAKAQGNLEFIYPGDHYIGHEGEVGDWPVENGKDISFYDNNDFGSYKSYHVLNGYADFMGGYYHDEDFGFGNIHNYDEMPGKKIWIWGLADEGMIWEDLLTDTKGQYIEYQTGVLFNQAMTRSSFTPFKHREFIPYDSHLSRELWFPVKGTGGMVKASEYAVMNLERINTDSVKVSLSALSPLNHKLIVRSMDGELLAERNISLSPLEIDIFTVNLAKGQEFTVELGDDLLFYSSKKEDVIVNRPLEFNEDFNWHSAVGYYTQGLELEKQQSYIEGGQPYKKAHDLYLKSLELDPAYTPALNRIAFNYYRGMQYHDALKYVLKVLAIDTYDAEANYLFGIINSKLNKTADAKSGFSIASQSTSYRSAAHTGLARLFLKEKRYRKAVEYAQKALNYNNTNVAAMEIQAIAFRMKNNREEADKILEVLYDLDETSAFVANERIAWGGDNAGDLSLLITNELPAETYLQLAIKYLDYGFVDESINVLKKGPEYAIILLMLAYLDAENREGWLQKGLDASPYLVFPYRTETYEAINELMKESDHWKLKYYAALILWKKDRFSEAKDLIRQCGEKPDFAPFYLAKAKLFANDEAIVIAALNKAGSLAPDDWRVNKALAEHSMKSGDYVKAAYLARKSFTKYPEWSVLGMLYAEALIRDGKYKKAMDFLNDLVVIPYEGAIEGRNIYYETTIRLAFDALKRNKYKTAVKYAEKAKVWPKRLGTGKPYNPDERLENSIIAYCHEKLGDIPKSREYYLKVVEYGVKDGQKEGPGLYLQVQALQKLGKNEKITSLLENALANDPENEFILWTKAIADKDEKTVNDLSEKLQKEALASPIGSSFILLNDYLGIKQNKDTK